MITGFNTDVEHDGVVYHVQTEDKGLASPLILSLVYSRGEILASKRSRYDDLITKGFTDEALAERLKRQHLLICAAIRAGRLEELKRMGGQPPAAAIDPTAAISKATPKIKVKTKAPSPDAIGSETIIERAPVEFGSETIIEKAPVEFGSDTIIERAGPAESIGPQEDAVLPVVEQEEDETEITQETVLTRSPEGAPAELPIERADAYSIHDQRRLSPLGELPLEEGLRLTLLDEHDFRAGDSLTLRILVSYLAGNDEKPMNGVAISVKVLGTTFRPQIYSMKTKRDGVAIVSAQIPEFTSGRAAILIRAVANDSETEMRRVIHPA